MAARESKKAGAKPKTRLRLSKETLRDLDASGKQDVKGQTFGSNYQPASRLPRSSVIVSLTGAC